MHAIFAFSAVPLFLGALLSDWAYFGTQEIQWLNFAAWLNAGGMLIAGLVLLWALVEVLLSSVHRHRAAWVYLALWLVTFVIGFINALVHGKDGWATMPTGLVLSVVVVVLAAAASALGIAGFLRRTA